MSCITSREIKVIQLLNGTYSTNITAHYELKEIVDKCVSMANSRSRLFDEYIMVWRIKRYKF